MRRRALLLALVAAAFPAAAHAHLVTTGLGPLYDGMTHLAVSPADLLLVLGLAILGGLGGAERGRWALATLPAGWLLGGLLGMAFSAELLLGVATALGLVVVGGLVAADAALSRATVLALVGGLGFFYGLLNGTALAAARSGPLGLMGIVLTVALLVSLVAALVVAARRPWMRVVARVAGSWIAAIGVLMVGWALR